MTDELEGMWKKAVVSKYGIMPAYAWRSWGSKRITAIGTAADPAKIQIRHTLYVRLERY
jgi:hypothetical protein